MLVNARTSVTDMNYHLVFVTKYRKKMFTTKELRDKLKKSYNLSLIIKV